MSSCGGTSRRSRSEYKGVDAALEPLRQGDRDEVLDVLLEEAVNDVHSRSGFFTITTSDRPGRLAAVFALGQLGVKEERVLKVLRTSLAGKGSLVSAEAALALAALNDLDSLAQIEEMSRSNSSEAVRKLAIAALGDLADARSIPVLRAIAEDPDPMIAAQARAHLERMEFVERERSGPHSAVARSVADVIVAGRVPMLAFRLLPALQQLEALDSPDVRAYLVSLRDDSGLPNVARAAAEVLEHLARPPEGR